MSRCGEVIHSVQGWGIWAQQNGRSGLTTAYAACGWGILIFKAVNPEPFRSRKNTSCTRGLEWKGGCRESLPHASVQEVGRMLLLVCPQSKEEVSTAKSPLHPKGHILSIRGWAWSQPPAPPHYTPAVFCLRLHWTSTMPEASALGHNSCTLSPVQWMCFKAQFKAQKLFKQECEFSFSVTPLYLPGRQQD